MTDIDDAQPTKVIFNAIPRAVTAMELAAANTGLSRTDALNRAIQLYAGLTGHGSWFSVRLVWHELKTLRRFAIEDALKLRCREPTCPDFGDPDFGEGTCPAEHADPPGSDTP